MRAPAGVAVGIDVVRRTDAKDCVGEILAGPTSASRTVLEYEGVHSLGCKCFGVGKAFVNRPHVGKASARADDHEGRPLSSRKGKESDVFPSESDPKLFAPPSPLGKSVENRDRNLGVDARVIGKKTRDVAHGPVVTVSEFERKQILGIAFKFGTAKEFADRGVEGNRMVRPLPSHDFLSRSGMKGNARGHEAGRPQKISSHHSYRSLRPPP